MIEKIIGLMPGKVEILQCKVITENPLLLQVVDEPKRQIPEDFLILTRNVTDYTVKADIVMDSGIFKLSGSSAQTIDIINSTDLDLTVKNALKVGEIVLVVAFDESQKFVIIDRVV